MASMQQTQKFVVIKNVNVKTVNLGAECLDFVPCIFFLSFSIYFMFFFVSGLKATWSTFQRILCVQIVQ